jgi:hypothetical protein
MLTDADYATGFDVIEREAPRSGMTQSGYGNRLPSHRMIRFHGEKTLYRVYVICYSNAGTCYVVRKGRRLIVKNSDLS